MTKEALRQRQDPDTVLIHNLARDGSANTRGMGGGITTSVSGVVGEENLMIRENATQSIVIIGKKFRFLEKDDLKFLLKFGQSFVDVGLVVGVL